MKTLGYYNGSIGVIEEISIPMEDRACFFGDGVYDATYSRNYHIYGLMEHIDRLYNSAQQLQIHIDMEKSDMVKLLQKLVEKMDTGENFVYWQVTRGTGRRNHVFPDGKANLWAYILPKGLVDVYKKVDLITMEDTRFLHCNIKSLNLIPAVIASQKAKEAGCFETVFHRNGRITECAHSNVHILKDGVFRTAPTDNLILPGITRRHLILSCHKLGIPVDETPFTLEELISADEIIVSSSGALCIAAKSIDGVAVGDKAPQLLQALQDEMLRDFYEQTE